MSMPDDDMPKDFGIKYVFWMVCRWVYFNPLTILLCLQDMALQLIADYPAWKWVGTVGGILGIIIAQVRNIGKDYTVPVAQTQVNQAAAILVANPLTTPVTPAQPSQVKP